MKMISASVGIIFLLCLSSAATQNAATTIQPAAQNSQPVQAQARTVEPPAKIILREGTDVRLKFAQTLSSKTAVDDDPINFVLDEDLKVGDVTVVKAGAKAVGTVTNSKKAGMLGKSGELNLRLEYLVVGDSRLRLRGTKGKEGEGKVGTAVALTVIFGPIGLIKHGKNVDIKEGAPLSAYTDQDYTVPAPM